MPKKLDRYEVIWKCIQKHGYNYDYRKMNYINSTTKVCIICSMHGEFWQRPIDHWRGCGCPKCSGVNHSNNEEFINAAKEIHKNDDGSPKYIYTNVNYINNKTKVCIICPKHGEFWQRPNDHLSGYGCYLCSKTKYDTELFIKKAKEIHKNEDGTPKYIYTEVDYKNMFAKVCIICPKHGEFWQRPYNHINNATSCPTCNSNNKSNMEENIYDELIKLTDNVERQKTFDWLRYKSYLYLDFYLPEYRVAVEVQGEQHFRPIKRFGGDEFFQRQKKRDEEKLRLCNEHNIKLFYITKRNNNIDEIKEYINEARSKTKK